jgi:hypothetical protein
MRENASWVRIPLLPPRTRYGVWRSLASAPALEADGRRFKSCYSDQQCPSGGMVDTGDSKSPASRRVGSNPTSGTTKKWIFSSVGRAAPLQGVGRRFEPVKIHQRIRSLAQSGSASALGAEGRRFESCNSDQLKTSFKRANFYMRKC